MFKLDHLDLVFPQEYLKATLLISLLTVWLLVGLFYYLNRYTRRDYFAIWTAGWLFYALWLTASLNFGNPDVASVIFMVKQCCVSLSAVFLLWGSLRFLGLPVSQKLFGMFMLFLAAWTVVSPQVIENRFQIQLPVFILLGGSSLFAGVCFFRLRKQKAFVGAGMLSLGFLLWGFYLGTYPLSLQFGNLYSAGFFVSAVLQLFIAVSMIVLVLEEVRDNMVQKERLHAVGKMAVSMAHDVNNALSPITGYSEMLLAAEENLSPAGRKQLEKITAAAGRVAEIVATMREAYRRELDPELLAKIAAANKPDSSPAIAPARGEYEPCRSLRILYIDDEPGLRNLLHDLLELQDHKVSVASCGKEGLAMFRSNQATPEPYEVVITDLGMPEMDGRVVAKVLRSESPKTPVIMLTGWGKMMKDDGETVPEVDAILAKPPHMADLNNLLRHVTAN